MKTIVLPKTNKTENFIVYELNNKSYFIDPKILALSEIEFDKGGYYLINMDYGIDIIVPYRNINDEKIVFESLRNNDLYNVEIERIKSLQKVVGFPQKEKPNDIHIGFDIDEQTCDIDNLLNTISDIALERIIEQCDQDVHGYFSDCASQILTIVNVVKDKVKIVECNKEKIIKDIRDYEKAAFPEHFLVERFTN